MCYNSCESSAGFSLSPQVDLKITEGFMGGGAWLPWHCKRTSVESLRSKFPWKNPDAQIHLEAMGTNQGHGEDEMN